MYSLAAILIGTPLASPATGFARELTALILLEFCSSLSFNSSATFTFLFSILACTDQCCGLSPVDRHIDMHELLLIPFRPQKGPERAIFWLKIGLVEEVLKRLASLR